MWRCCLISGGAVGQFLAEDYYVVHQTYDTGSTTTMTDLIITCCTYWVYYLLKNGMEWNGIEQRGMGRMHSSCCWRGCGALVLLRQSVRHDTTRHVISIQITLSLHVPCLRVVSFVFYKQARVHEEMRKHVCAIEYSPSQERTLHVPSNEFAESAKNLEARNELNRLKREANHSAASELLK